jgi:hypothetical protein
MHLRALQNNVKGIRQGRGGQGRVVTVDPWATVAKNIKDKGE